MGVYLYTIRAKAQQVMIDGHPTAVHNFCFAYKFYSYNSKGQEFAINNFHRHAESAFARRRSNYVVLCGDKGMHDGDVIYQDVTRAEWVDTGKFPATPMGFVKKIGLRWYVQDRTDYHWAGRGWTSMGAVEGAPLLPCVRRSRMERNPTTGVMEVVTDQQYADHNTQRFITLEEAIELGRARQAAARLREAEEANQLLVMQKHNANPGTQFSLF